MRQHLTTTRSASRRRGLTLAEVAVSSLLVGLVLITSMKTVGGVIRTWRVTEQQHNGVALAADMMAEVMQARYFEPDEVEESGGGGGLLGGLLGLLGGGGSGVPYGLDDGESSANRDAWDDTDDYDGWSKSPPQAKDGTVLSDYNGWTRAVVVQKVNVGEPNNVRADSSPDRGVRRITVTVTAPDGTQTVLVGLRSYCGAMEQSPSAETTFVTWVGSQLQVGTGTTVVRSGINISNHTQDE